MRLDDLFESADYDLQKKYDSFNELLFDGALPKIPLIWKKMKNVGGQVVFSTMLEPGRIPPHIPARYRRMVKRDPYKDGYRVVWPSVRLEMSNLWQRTEAEADGILVHEMIHVWMLVQNNIGEMHGTEFMAKLRELEAKVTFKIPVTEKMSNRELTDPSTTKKIGVLYMQKKDGQYVYAILSEKAAREGLPEIQRRFSNYVDGTYSYASFVKLVVVNSEAWTKKAMAMTVQRTVSYKMKMFTMKPEAAGALVKDLEGAEVLWEVRRDTQV